MSNHAIIAECLIRGAAELRALREALPDRRERIATAAMAGLLQVPFGSETTDRQIAAFAIGIADALIAELDKKEDGT